TVLEPDTGALASGLSGKGRFPEIEDIVEAVCRMLSPVRDLTGERLLVTAGPTREPIDPVRYISNRSSGKMGYGLATAALRRGAEVTLVSGPTALTPPPGSVFVPVQTAEEMREAVLHHLDRATIVVKAAAVADYRARQASSTKIKGKRDLTLELTPNSDILAEVAARRTSAFIVGFAAETHDVAANAPTRSARSARHSVIIATSGSTTCRSPAITCSGPPRRSAPRRRPSRAAASASSARDARRSCSARAIRAPSSS